MKALFERWKTGWRRHLAFVVVPLGLYGRERPLFSYLRTGGRMMESCIEGLPNKSLQTETGDQAWLGRVERQPGYRTMTE